MANGKESTFPWSDVVVDPNTTSTVYAAVGCIFGTANNGVYKSTDSGATWTLLNAAPAPVGATFGRISIAISKASNTNVLYIAAEDNTTTGHLARFVRSDNAGASFTDLTAGTPNYMGGQGWYDTTLLVDPTSSAIVYAAGAAGANSMLRSTNSGANWTDISHTGVAVQPHADHHGVDFDANGKLLDGDDGGIYRLDDPTVPTWANLNGNLNTIQFEGIGLHPTNPNIVIGGSQDNGTELYTGALLWTEVEGGDGGLAQFSPTNGSLVYHQISCTEASAPEISSGVPPMAALAGSPGPPVCREITHRISMLLSLLIRAMVTAFYMALPMCGKLRTRVTCGPPSPQRGLADLTVAEIM